MTDNLKPEGKAMIEKKYSYTLTDAKTIERIVSDEAEILEIFVIKAPSPASFK